MVINGRVEGKSNAVGMPDRPNDSAGTSVALLVLVVRLSPAP